MMKKIFKFYNACVYNMKEYILIHRRKRNEINKFQDKRRIEIYNEIKLDDDQRKKIDDLFLENYGGKIPYTWHRHYTAFTGKFDENYFPELLFIPEFEHFMNVNKAYSIVFSDKNMLPMLAEMADVKVPRVFLSRSAGAYRDSNYKFVSRDQAIDVLYNIGEIFVKPTTDSCSGQGCAVYNIKSGKDVSTQKNIKDILDSMGDDFVIQERLQCHQSIKKIYSGSVNTFRVITYRWKDKIFRMPSIMRIGQGGNYIDNAHAGGMFIAIDDDGTLHDTAFTEFKKTYEKHPDTHLIFSGHKISFYDKVVDAAVRMHEMIPQLGVLHWDFTIDEYGQPVLVEVNVNGGGIWIVEMAHGCGAFGENTASVLKWLRFIKSLPPIERRNYCFGKMKN